MCFCGNNTIKPSIGAFIAGENIFVLPGNVFSDLNGTNLFIGNFLDINCTNNLFYGYANSNVLGQYCKENTFHSNFSFNKFGNNCNNNTFGDNCSNNIFGNYCIYNTFGDNSSNNIFGNNCDNFLVNGISFRYNIFGNNCSYITVGDFCKYNTFGNYCQYIKFGNSSVTNNNYLNNIIENGNNHIYFDTTQQSTANVMNITIAQGVNDSTTYKTITHTTDNDTFQTIYRPANSQVISV